jgi:EF hand
MTTTTAKKKRSRLQQDFIPDFEMRSVLVIATFAASAAMACAQTNARPPTLADQNHPGTMTPAADRSEGVATQLTTRSSAKSLDAAFNRADTNRDGRLNRQEAGHFPVLSPRFDVIDLNRDSFISREEFHRAAGN